MANRMTGEARPYEQKRSNFQKKVNFVDCSDTSDSDDDQMVGSLNGFKTIRSRSHVLSVTKNPRSMGLMLPRLT